MNDIVRLFRAASLGTSGIFTLLAPLSVAAQTPPQQPASKPQQQEVVVVGQLPQRLKTVCEITVPTGSIRSQKVCRTQQEMDDIHNRSMAELARLQDERNREQQMRITCQMMGKC